MRACVLAGVTAMLVAALVAASAFADRTFSGRYRASERGQIISAGNSLLTCSGSTACLPALSGLTSRDNNGFDMRYLDIDGDPSTFNSSRATVTLPSGSTVLFAGLYWSADTSAGSSGSSAPTASARGTVRLDTPTTSSYATITASRVDSDSMRTTRYQGFADVTSAIAAGGNGTYTVANVQAGTGANRYAGWGLVVAYRLASEPVRRLLVYDGFLAVQSGVRPSADLTLDGFLAPASGTAGARLALLAYEGDHGSTGDAATLGTTALTNGANPVNDFFNSSVSRDGAGVESRSPATVNTLGLDLDELDVSSALAGGSTSATLRVSSTGSDVVLPGAVGLSLTDSPPASVTAPASSGTTRDGQTLTASTGTWASASVVTYAYQWQRCNGAGTGCTNVSGATSSTYALGPADVGSTMKVVVSATNAAGSTSANSAASGQVTAAPPVNTTAPAISGTTRDGELLSLSTGTWTGTPTTSHAYGWQRCNAAGTGCAAISGATGATYRLTAADVGSTIRGVVTATNAAGSASATTTQSAAISAAPPVNATLPSVSGTARDGGTLTGDRGTWTGSAPISYAYQWRRCDVSGANCADISGATSLSYGPVGADVGATLRLAVTATNAAGTATAVPPPSERVTAAPPVNTAAPTVSGTARDGSTLTVSGDGTWTGTRPLAFSYQWQRCNAAGAACADIAGATTTSYTLTPADVGRTVAARVTATNSVGSATAAAPSAQVAAAPPVNTSPPTVSGVSIEGQMLTAQPGTWTGTPTLSYAYAWQRCDAAGANCSPIAGATSSTYTATADDTGRRLRVSVTATNGAGSATGVSATASVNPAAPVSTVAPTVDGTPREGSTLTAAEGTWNGSRPLTYAYQWVRCDASGTSCANIADATSRTYGAAPADVGARLRVRVTATNAAGNATVTSGPSAAIDARPPANATVPSISGTPRDGATLTADPGTWTGTEPISLAVRWQRCTAEAGCTDIPGATATTYTATQADVDAALRVVVTASNAGGTTSASSAHTAAVGAAPPANASAPVISGDGRHGATLSVTTGAWSGTAPISYAYQWRRCTSAGAGCIDIAGATSSTYTATGADVGGTLQVVVTASNPGGSSTAASATTAIVAANPPVNTSAPQISGRPRDGVQLSVSTGTWTGTAPIDFTFQWQRCDAGGADCADIAGATARTFTPGPTEIGRSVRAVVTATNDAGSVSATTTATAAVDAAPPVDTTPPAISGTAVHGSTLSASTGTWTGTEPISYAYRWQRCTGEGTGCADIPGASSRAYTLTGTDLDGTVRVVVTATNAAGSASAESAPSGNVAAAPPVNRIAPTVEGTPADGATLTATPGSWGGTEPISFAYQWQRCDGAARACVPIAGAIDSTYTATGADVGSALRVVVTATNRAGSAPAASSRTGSVDAAPPTNTAVPAVSGATRDGATLTASTGTWTGTAPIDFTYGWQRCDGAGANCADIDGATASTYDLVPSDVGSRVRVVVTTTNDGGTRTAASEPSAVVAAALPVNTASPTISGIVRDGAVLTAAPGTWTGTPAITYAYRWQRCDSADESCADIADADDSSYRAGAGDVGGTLRVVVTASNGGGSASATSDPTEAVAAAPPANTVLPAISGTVQDGAVLTASDGEWTGTAPISYAYGWRRCDGAGDNCADIVGATGQTYRATAADVGNTLRIFVTATNDAGSASATSFQTGTAAPAPPANTAAPEVSGEARDGETLSVSTGDWSGTDPITFGYAWERCSVSGGGCAPIAGATASTYTLTADDVGSRVRAVVTAVNDAGRRSAPSAPTATVDAAAPVNTAEPTIAGTVADGEVLTAAPGTWTGTGPIDFTYQWRRCAADGTGCADLAGATGQAYTAGPDDVGATLRVVVTARNDGGETPATSAPTGAVAADAAQSEAPPTVSGTPRDGETLTATIGNWTGTTPSDFAYQWRRCDGDGENCQPIDGATAATYVATDDDVGSRLRVRVTGTNGGGSDSSDSAATAVVAPAPATNTQRPSVTGTAQVGETQTVDPGEWSGTAPIDFAYQWQRCAADGTGCVDIAGATVGAYTAVAADERATVRVVVTPSNGAGTGASEASPVTAVVAGPAVPANSSPPAIIGTAAAGGALTADPGQWTESPTSYTYQWERCDASGASCVDIDGAKGSTYTPGAADLGSTLRVEVTAANGQGAGSAVRSEQTAPVEGSGATSTPSPGTPSQSSPATAGQSTGAGTPSAQPTQPGATATDLAGLFGSLVAPARCATLVSGGGFQRVNAAAAGAVRLRIRSDGAVVPGAPLVVTVTADRARGLRAVRYTLDGRVLRASRGATHRLALAPRRLKPGRRVLTARLTLAGGLTRTIRRSIRIAACAARFTARQYRTAAGTGLRLRVDTATAASAVTLRLPSAVARRLSRGTPAGRIRMVTPTLRRQFRFSPATSRGPSQLTPGNGRPGVRVSGRMITVTGLPASTGIVELTVYQPRAPRGAAQLPSGRRVTATAAVRTTRTLRLRATLRGTGGSTR